MRKIDSLFEEYGESHQTKFNKRIHYVCVPAIFFSIIGLLSCLPFNASFIEGGLAPYIHWGTIGLILGLLYYLRLSVPMSIGMTLFSVFVIWGNHQLAQMNLLPYWLLSLIIFVVAWIFQFIGHNHEGKKPSFLKDLQFLLIGPGWILGSIYRRLGIKY